MKTHQEKIDFNKRIKRLFFRFLKEENVFHKFIFNYYNCMFDEVFLDPDMWDEDDTILLRKNGFSVIEYIEKVIDYNSKIIFFDAFQWDKDPNIDWKVISTKWGNLFNRYENLEYRRKEMIII